MYIEKMSKSRDFFSNFEESYLCYFLTDLNGLGVVRKKTQWPDRLENERRDP